MFCKTGVVKNLKFEKKFNATQISAFCQISCLAEPGVIKNPKFEQNFQCDSNFLILPNRGCQKSKIRAKVLMWLKFDFVKFHVLQDWGGQQS